jgi:hypothetical protein
MLANDPELESVPSELRFRRPVGVPPLQAPVRGGRRRCRFADVVDSTASESSSSSRCTGSWAVFGHRTRRSWGVTAVRSKFIGDAVSGSSG